MWERVRARVRAGPLAASSAFLRAHTELQPLLPLSALPLRWCLCPFSAWTSPFARPRRSPSVPVSLPVSPLSVFPPPFPQSDSEAAPLAPHSCPSGSRRFLPGQRWTQLMIPLIFTVSAEHHRPHLQHYQRAAGASQSCWPHPGPPCPWVPSAQCCQAIQWQVLKGGVDSTSSRPLFFLGCSVCSWEQASGRDVCASVWPCVRGARCGSGLGPALRPSGSPPIP